MSDVYMGKGTIKKQSHWNQGRWISGNSGSLYPIVMLHVLGLDSMARQKGLKVEHFILRIIEIL